MTDMRRTILWVVFLMSLVLLWDAWNKHQGRPTMFGMPAPTATTAGSAPAGVPASAALPAPATAGAAPAAPVTTAPVASEKLWITTDVFKAQIDTQGGTLTHVELLKHRDAVDASKPMVLLDQSATHTYVAQTGLISKTATGAALPNHVTTMTVLPGARALADGQDELRLTLESPAVNGVTYRKSYVFKRGDYAIGVKHEIVNAGGEAVEPQLYLQLERDGSTESHAGFLGGAQTFTGPALYTPATKFKKIEFKDIDKGGVELPTGATEGWTAMVQHYFVSAWLPPEGAAREFRVSKNGALYSLAAVLPLAPIAAGQSATLDTRLYVGPQEEKRLEALAPGLELVKDYGIFTIISKPLFWLLDQLHKLVGNWGWAIVALVVLIKAAFYWLNAKAYASMAKMKAINPKVMELRERLKDKPQQMQQEMMRIYREEKVNPLGGCLPIMVQIPVFIALYWVLLSSVEMRNAPWLGWITDLSAKDPYYILPLVMTATTMLQTWLNPTPPDPVQAKMMWIMPLVFSVMFFFFPAGLVLYWITNNVLSIAQQWVINKRLGVN
ncbi:membrane protein insertase YidC [Caldimonas sp. KR1-144]|uniref:membrane protein insertase YidC n=1 Tax=Caldimonas sp. KR1-144 TaxID=3400911 RepID=UPI003C09A199